MAQLTLKELDEKIKSTWAAITSVEDRVVGHDTDIATLGNGFVEVDKLIGELNDRPVITSLETVPPLDIIRGVIEALYGVRLARAQGFALVLEAKYFPGEEVVLTKPV